MLGKAEKEAKQNDIILVKKHKVKLNELPCILCVLFLHVQYMRKPEENV